ncbi:hypothetical protein ACHAXS_004231, partial [Conticribra weissflogii]
MESEISYSRDVLSDQRGIYSSLGNGDRSLDGDCDDCDHLPLVGQDKSDRDQEEGIIIETPATMTAAESVADSSSTSSNSALGSTISQLGSHGRRTKKHSCSTNSGMTKTMAMTNFLSTLLLLLSTSSTSHAATEATVDSTSDPNRLCSCSPLLYTFKLNLKASCPPTPPPYPPNDFFGAGVKDYTCTIGPEPVDSASNDMVDLEEMEFPTEFPVEFPEGEEEKEEEDGDSGALDALDEEPVRRWLATKGRRRLNDGGSGNEGGSTQTIDLPDGLPTDIPGFTVTDGDFNTGNSGITDFEPVVIDSIQFIEVDPQFNVINQDPSFVSGIAFQDGQEFNFTSVSYFDARGKNATTSTVPGGMSMVLRGMNENGDRLRNVFTITYTNDCQVETFSVGDAIGWVVLEDFIPASESTCDASFTDSPIAAPTSIPYTAPTLAPIPLAKTAIPTEYTPAPTPYDENKKTTSPTAYIKLPETKSPTSAPTTTNKKESPAPTTYEAVETITPTAYGKLPDSPTLKPSTVAKHETPAPSGFKNIESESPTALETRITTTPTAYGKQETNTPTSYGSEETTEPTVYGKNPPPNTDLSMITLISLFPKSHKPPYKPSRPSHKPRPSHSSSGDSSQGSKTSKNSKRGGNSSSSSSSSWKSRSSSWDSSWSRSSKSSKGRKSSKSSSSHSSSSSNASPAYHWRQDDDDDDDDYYSKKYYFGDSVRRLRETSQNQK